jgi:hypothetical protein
LLNLPASANFLLGLLSDPEDGGNMFLQRTSNPKNQYQITEIYNLQQIFRYEVFLDQQIIKG